MGNTANKIAYGSTAGAALTIPDGSTSVGGKYLIIDSITWTATSSSTLTLATSGSTIWSAVAGTAGTQHFAFPNGLPVVDLTAFQPGVTTTVTGAANGGTCSVGYHYRSING
jgi:hypothetical protein